MTRMKSHSKNKNKSNSEIGHLKKRKLSNIKNSQSNITQSLLNRFWLQRKLSFNYLRKLFHRRSTWCNKKQAKLKCAKVFKLLKQPRSESNMKTLSLLKECRNSNLKQTSTILNKRPYSNSSVVNHSQLLTLQL